ncbi:MAG: hypothetical protein Tsb0014_08080 [Pleurocapsa sp.]
MAQISSDETLPTNVNTTDGKNFTINNGKREGDNLFHSFREFSVPTLGSVEFKNASDIANIFSRVTGGNISSIDGLIKVNGSANLFLINPAGIIFGENARLDLGGSFYGSTANNILFPDDIEFSAGDTSTPILSINAPIGLGFRDEPGEIVNRSVTQDAQGNIIGLKVSPGQDLSLIGGRVVNEGGAITALDGNIFLGGITTAGTVVIDKNSGLSLPENGIRSDVLINNGAWFYVLAEGRGTINIIGNNIEISQADIIAGVDIGLGNRDIEPGAINIDATDTVTITNGFISNPTLGTGNGGELNINAGNSINIDASQIGTGAFQVPGIGTVTLGNSGDINLTSNLVKVDNASVLSTVSEGEGNAGDFNIQATSLSLDNASVILNSTLSTGNAGSINVEVNSLSLINGGELSSTTEEAGNAGRVNVNATDSITLIGTAPVEDINGFPGGYSSGLFSSSEAGATGKGGTVTVATDKLQISDGATLSVRTRNTGEGGDVIVNANILEITGGGQILTAAFGQGDAGDITLNISEEINIVGSDPTFENRREQVIKLTSQFDPEIIVDPEQTIDPISSESGIFANTGSNSAGNGGSISISGLTEGNNTQSFVEQLTLVDNGQVSVNSQGQGNGGNLFIKANSLRLDNNAAILAGTPSGQGGEIKLKIADKLLMDNNSLISAQATNNANGGNIDIDAKFIIAVPNQNNDILASAERGIGGDINITTKGIFGIEERSENSLTNDIDASSEFNLDGTVTIINFDNNPLQGVEELPRDLVELESTVTQACRSDNITGEASGLIITGKGGIRHQPIESLNSDTILINGKIVTLDSQIQAPNVQPIKTATRDIYPARGIIKTEDGQIILTAYSTERNFSRTPNIQVNCTH